MTHRRLLLVLLLVVPFIIDAVWLTMLVGNEPVGPAIVDGRATVRGEARSETATLAPRDDRTAATEATPVPLPTLPPPAMAPLLGADGRFTLLVLGSDAAPAREGERTDVIMLLIADPASGRASAVSLPRDTTGVPIRGSRYRPRINGLFGAYLRQVGDRDQAARAVAADLAMAFGGIEIDRYLVLAMRDAAVVVDAAGPIELELDEPFRDDSVKMHKGKTLKLPAGTVSLDGETALAYARSRKTDSDYARSARQQELLLSLARRLRTAELGELGAIGRVLFARSDTDLGLEDVPGLVGIVDALDLTDPERYVLAPFEWAVEGSTRHTTELRTSEVRDLFARLYADPA